MFSFKDGWREETNLPEVINNPAITGYEPDKTLYIIGGRIQVRDLNTVRVLKGSKWEFGPYLPEKISGAHALFLDHVIYVFGGTSKQILKYSPKTDIPATWHKHGQLNSKRQYLGNLYIKLYRIRNGEKKINFLIKILKKINKYKR